MKSTYALRKIESSNKFLIGKINEANFNQMNINNFKNFLNKGNDKETYTLSYLEEKADKENKKKIIETKYIGKPMTEQNSSYLILRIPPKNEQKQTVTLSNNKETKQTISCIEIIPANQWVYFSKEDVLTINADELEEKRKKEKKEQYQIFKLQMEKQANKKPETNNKVSNRNTNRVKQLKKNLNGISTAMNTNTNKDGNALAERPNNEIFQKLDEYKKKEDQESILNENRAKSKKKDDYVDSSSDEDEKVFQRKGNKGGKNKPRGRKKLEKLNSEGEEVVEDSSSVSERDSYKNYELTNPELINKLKQVEGEGIKGELEGKNDYINPQDEEFIKKIQAWKNQNSANKGLFDSDDDDDSENKIKNNNNNKYNIQGDEEDLSLIEEANSNINEAMKGSRTADAEDDNNESFFDEMAKQDNEVLQNNDFLSRKRDKDREFYQKVSIEDELKFIFSKRKVISRKEIEKELGHISFNQIKENLDLILDKNYKKFPNHVGEIFYSAK